MTKRQLLKNHYQGKTQNQQSNLHDWSLFEVRLYTKTFKKQCKGGAMTLNWTHCMGSDSHRKNKNERTSWQFESRQNNFHCSPFPEPCAVDCFYKGTCRLLVISCICSTRQAPFPLLVLVYIYSRGTGVCVGDICSCNVTKPQGCTGIWYEGLFRLALKHRG